MMKGRTVTAEQKRFHDLLANHVGCIACFIDTDRERRNTYVSIHHIDGRTKPNAHWLVLPLCAGHHQDGTGWPGLIAVHPWKRWFEDVYGKQEDLLRECCNQLLDMGHTVPADVLDLV